MNKFHFFRWVAVVVSSLTLVLGIQGPAMADTGADGFPIIYATLNQEVHKCEQIGSSDSGYYRAVVCVDIVTQNDVNGYGIYAQLEAICENSSGVIQQCESVVTNGIWASGIGTIGKFGSSCGDGLAACPSGRFYAASFEIWPTNSQIQSCGTVVASELQEWMVAYANETTIKLPNDVPIIGPAANFSSGHDYICY